MSSKEHFRLFPKQHLAESVGSGDYETNGHCAHLLPKRGTTKCLSEMISNSHFPDDSPRASQHRLPTHNERSRRDVDGLIEELPDQILQRYRMGESIADLAQLFARSQTAIRSLICSHWSELLSNLPLEYVDDPAFGDPDRETEILAVPPAVSVPDEQQYRPSQDLPAYLASLHTVPLLTKEREYSLFLKMNFLKYRAVRLLNTVEGAACRLRELARIQALVDKAAQIRELLIRSNLRLVVAVAKKLIGKRSGLFEAVSDGNVALMRAVELFDVSRGFRFSTYATWAIHNKLIGVIPRERTHQQRFQTQQEMALAVCFDHRDTVAKQQQNHALHRQTLDKLLGGLPDRDRQIVSERFGLDYKEEPKTLAEISDRLGVSKERIRQIECRALGRMRKLAEQYELDLPE